MRARLCEGCGSDQIARKSNPAVADGWLVFDYRCSDCNHEFVVRVAPRTDFERRAEAFEQGKIEAARMREVRTEAERQSSARDAADLAEAKARGLAQLDAEIELSLAFEAARPLAVIAERGDLTLARGTGELGLIHCRCGFVFENGTRDLLVALWSLGHLAAECGHRAVDPIAVEVAAAVEAERSADDDREAFSMGADPE